MGQLQERYKNYRVPQKYMEAGVYPYFREITSKQMTDYQTGNRRFAAGSRNRVHDENYLFFHILVKKLYF